MAIFAISSFVIIFVTGILWATRPVSKSDAKTHGTTQHPGSL